ncbi:MAG: hypothetical protein COB08_008100 [Rhodobacteraceae bacterium]|nr:hypothetical protein [Paracoccaceae bacterium]
MSFDLENIAVLTGDIVKSTALSRDERDALFAGLKAGADAVEALQDEPAQFERFSGDSWQMLVQPKLALRASLVMRAFIRQESKSFETRISVGIGAVEPLSPEGLGASDGPAFWASGRGLKALKGAQYFCTNTGNKPIFILADEISKRWTQAQARVLAFSLLLPHPTQESVASKVGISQQSVRNHLAAAGEPALLAALADIEYSL